MRPPHSRSIVVMALLIASWTAAQYTQVHLGLAGSSLEDITFPTPDVGYASGKNGALYKSTDGGQNWVALTTGSGAYFFGVSFLNADTGFVSGGGATVLRTTDGGASWTPLTLPFTECVYQVQPITASLVYAAGWGGFFFRSTDGGDNWTISSIDTGWQGWVFGMHFSDADNGWVAETDGRIYRTVDGGMNWTQATTTTTNTLRAISMATPTTGFAVGFFGTAQKSTDGGATWSTLNTGYPGDSYYGVHFTDADNGAICGGYYVAGGWQGVVMHTDDGGTTWDRVHTGGPVLNAITTNTAFSFTAGTNEVILTDALSTGIDAAKSTASLSVHPNPASSIVTIRTSIQGPCVLDVFDALGACVLTAPPQSGDRLLDVAGWEPGAYLIRVGSADAIHTTRLVVVK